MMPLYLFLILVICWITSLYVTRTIFMKLKENDDNVIDDPFIKHSTQITRNISFIVFIFLIIQFLNINIITWIVFIYYAIIGVIQLVLLCVSLFYEIPYNKKIVTINKAEIDRLQQLHLANEGSVELNIFHNLETTYSVTCWLFLSNLLNEISNIVLIISAYTLIK